MAYVDRDPQTLARRKELKKMMRKRNRDDENEQSRIAQLIQAAVFITFSVLRFSNLLRVCICQSLLKILVLAF